MEQNLFYSRPASGWLESLPIGNGRLAAMLDGGEKVERLTLNHEELWNDKYSDRDSAAPPEALAEVRAALRDGDHRRATELAHGYFSGTPGFYRYNSFVPAAVLSIETDQTPVSPPYCRRLDLADGIASVRYGTFCGPAFEREYFASAVSGRIHGRIRTADGRAFNLTLGLERCLDPDCVPLVTVSGDRLILEGRLNTLCFRVEVDAIVSGAACVRRSASGKLQWLGVEEFRFHLDIGVAASPEAAAAICARSRDAAGMDWEEARAAHVARHRELFAACRLALPFAAPDLSTDERLRRLRAGEADPALAQLYFDYGRYLMIASTVLGRLPPNLQGKWSEDINPPWMGIYVLDVNLEMAYWGVEALGFDFAFDALMDLLERTMPHGRKIARSLFGCDGIFLPSAIDDSGRATPESYGWTGFWCGGAAWIARHVWEHWEYTGDRDFLARRGYPFLRGVADFWSDFLCLESNGHYRVMPSMSPENCFEHAGDWAGSCCISSTCDLTLAASVLEEALAAAAILGCDEDRQTVWRDRLARLDPIQLGPDGRLLEWDRDYVEREPGHRHFSHLIGLFPFDDFFRPGNEALLRGAELAFDRRMAANGGHTGWSRAWAAGLSAALGRGDETIAHLEALIRDFSSDALLDLHPPRVFQIDGNFGGIAAVLRMLIQERDGVVYFLPALPSAWPDGSLHRVCCRGGFTVALTWRGGVLREFSVAARHGGVFRWQAGDVMWTIAGTARPITFANGVAVLTLMPGESVTLFSGQPPRSGD